MSRALPVLLLVSTACGARVVAPPAMSSPSHASTRVADVELCGGPGDDRARKKLATVESAACVRFVPVFEAAVRESCDGTFVEALRRIDDRRRWDGTYSAATRKRRNEALGSVFDVETVPERWDAPIVNIDEHWADGAPHELIAGIEGPRVGGAIGEAPAGAWYFAAALAHRVSPRGMRHVRRFLVCETLERVAGYAREVGKGEVTVWLSPYLVEPLKN